MKLNEIKLRMKNRLSENNGKILNNFKIGNACYDIEELKMDEEGFQTIKEIYGDRYINYMFLPMIPMGDENFSKKLKKIVSEGKSDGITIWRIKRKEDAKTVGLLGFSFYDDEKTKIEVTYCSNLAAIVKILCKEMIKFFFEYLELDCFYGRCLSYNYYSQLILKTIGMSEYGIEKKEDDYLKDSYLTIFRITKDDYEKIKKNNNGTYEIFNISKKTDPKTLHKEARTIEDAIKESKDTNNIPRYNYCNGLLEFLQKRYPILYKK